MTTRLLNRLMALVPAFGLAVVSAALAASPIAMSVGPDETLTYPAGMGTPVLIAGSQFPVSIACAHGTSFDGWYPSFMSPGHMEGHIGLTGKVFFMDGCDGALGRQFKSRTFTITGGP